MLISNYIGRLSGKTICEVQKKDDEWTKNAPSIPLVSSPRKYCVKLFLQRQRPAQSEPDIMVQVAEEAKLGGKDTKGQNFKDWRFHHTTATYTAWSATEATDEATARVAKEI